MALSGHLVTTTDTYNQYKRRAAFDWSAAWDYDTHDWGITWNYSVEILESDVPTQNTYMSVGQWSITVNGTTKSGNENGTHYYNGHQFASGTFHLPADSKFTLSGYVYIGASETLTGTKHDLISSDTEDINSLGPSPEDVPSEERGLPIYFGVSEGAVGAPDEPGASIGPPGSSTPSKILQATSIYFSVPVDAIEGPILPWFELNPSLQPKILKAVHCYIGTESGIKQIY